MTAFLHLDLHLGLLLQLLTCWQTPGMVRATVPAAPVNVSVTQLRAHSATVTWNVLSGRHRDRLLHLTAEAGRLDAALHQGGEHVQPLSVGPHGDSPPSRAVHFRTLERSDHYPAGVLDHHEPAMEGLDMTPHLQTGELLIITTVLLLWAAVIALFCRQYDIIKDNDSSSCKEKAKRPLVRAAPPHYTASAGSSPLCHDGDLHRASSSVSIIRV
uniref:Fibronectin type III domain containing 10 n=1 Tax=Gasterosteus aculeatus aculeatus TaxID=481459 RepID=A0AAQ4Q1Z6_GASAC